MVVSIASDRQNIRTAARPQHLNRERLRVGIANLVTEGRLVYFNDFVAGGENSNWRFPKDGSWGAPRRCQQRDLGKSKEASWLEQYRLPPRFAPLRTDVFAGAQRTLNADFAALHRSVLHHHYRVSSCGHG